MGMPMQPISTQTDSPTMMSSGGSFRMPTQPISTQTDSPTMMSSGGSFRMPTQPIFTQTDKTPRLIPPVISSGISLDDFDLSETPDEIVDIPIEVISHSFIEYDLPFTKKTDYQDIHSPHNEFFTEQSSKEVGESRRGRLSDIDATPSPETLDDFRRRNFLSELRKVAQRGDLGGIDMTPETPIVDSDYTTPRYATPTISSIGKSVHSGDVNFYTPASRVEITPTIINPLTGRRIKTTGRTYKGLLKKGLVKK
jgi:hypothetical protein